MYVPTFHCIFEKALVRVVRVNFAHISMTTRARDFKFAGAIGQRLYLVMVALTQKFFLRIMLGLLVEGHN